MPAAQVSPAGSKNVNESRLASLLEHNECRFSVEGVTTYLVNITVMSTHYQTRMLLSGGVHAAAQFVAARPQGTIKF